MSKNTCYYLREVLYRQCFVPHPRILKDLSEPRTKIWGLPIRKNPGSHFTLPTLILSRQDALLYLFFTLAFWLYFIWRYSLLLNQFGKPLLWVQVLFFPPPMYLKYSHILLISFYFTLLSYFSRDKADLKVMKVFWVSTD